MLRKETSKATDGLRHLLICSSFHTWSFPLFLDLMAKSCLSGKANQQSSCFFSALGVQPFFAEVELKISQMI